MQKRTPQETVPCLSQGFKLMEKDQPLQGSVQISEETVAGLKTTKVWQCDS